MLETAIAQAQSPRAAHVYLQLDPEAARRSLDARDARALPLAGLPVSVKDLFDVAGCVTRCGSTVLHDAPPATRDAPAVQRLVAAGATLLGRTNMTEFAFSGVGINPHYGTPANAADTVCARVPGGSSAGAAVSVGLGAAMAALATDTGGSIRIPAALQGLVGFKPTAATVSLEGCFPLAPSLDSVGAITRTVRDAMLLHEVLSGQRVVRSQAPLAHYRLAVVRTRMLDALATPVQSAWAATLEALARAGIQVTTLDVPQIDPPAALQAHGGLAGIESYAVHRSWLQHAATMYDPRVRARLTRGAEAAAWEYLQMLQARRQWAAELSAVLEQYDAILSPTVPDVAPPLYDVAPGAERDAAFFDLNARLLRNTSVVNLLDGCGISIPCHVSGSLPVGLMIWHGAGRDNVVLNVADGISRLLSN